MKDLLEDIPDDVDVQNLPGDVLHTQGLQMLTNA